MPPDYYLVMTRFFAKPTDVQQRSVVVLTQFDAKLLRLFGVRFVISDDRLPEDANVTLRQSSEWEAAQPRNQFLYEIARPNLGNFAPTRQVIEPTAMGAVAKMREVRFNPEQHVILQAPIPVTLSDVLESSVHWQKTELRVRAKSSGRSLLVLPLQFSRCLEVKLENKTAVAEEPSLIRSDIALTGVQFSKELDATIRLRFGPFDNVLCRARDFFEFRQDELLFGRILAKNKNIFVRMALGARSLPSGYTSNLAPPRACRDRLRCKRGTSMLEVVGEFAIGAASLVVAVILFFIGIPRHGESPRFLRFDASVVLYPAVIMTFLAFGVGLMLRAYAG